MRSRGWTVCTDFVMYLSSGVLEGRSRLLARLFLVVILINGITVHIQIRLGSRDHLSASTCTDARWPMRILTWTRSHSVLLLFFTSACRYSEPVGHFFTPPPLIPNSCSTRKRLSFPLELRKLSA